MPKIIKSPLTVIVVLLSFTLASFWALIVWKGMQERALAFAKAGSETRGLTHSLAEHASKSFNAVALAMFAARQYIQHSDKSARASAEINDLLAQYAMNIPQAREVGVLSETGDWMFSSFKTVPAVNNADREYFRYHQSHPEDSAPRIGDPLISRVTGRPTLLMTQRLSNPDGSFGGVVFAAIDLAYFRSFYAGLEAKQERTITLLKTNGKVLVHQRDDLIGKDMAGSSLFASHLQDSATGLYSVVSPFDGRTKQFAYEMLSDFPIVITVAVAEDAILGTWRSDRNFDRLLGSAVSTILIALAGVLALQFRKGSAMARILYERERGYRLLAENVEDVVTRVDMKGNRLYISPSIEKLLGWTPAEIILQSAYCNIHPAHRDLIKSLIEQLGTSKPTATCEYLTLRRDGNYVWVEAQLNYVQGTGEPTAEIVGVIRDISKRKAAEEQLVAANEQLKTLSETDTLTGIANRRRFDRMFDAEFKRCQRSGSHLSVLFIDIDNFKSFNDTYGHFAGDDCIRLVAQALESCLKRPADLVARYGGEEFAVLLPETAPVNAEGVAETVRKAIADLAIPHQGSPHGCVTVSVGTAGGNCDTRTSTTSMLAAADGALYLAKEQGRNRVCAAAESPSLTLVRPDHPRYGGHGTR